MATTLQIPRILQTYSHGQPELRLAGGTVRALLAELRRTNPPLYRCLCDETGALRRHLHLFVNDDLVCDARSFEAPLGDADVVSVFQAVSGG